MTDNLPPADQPTSFSDLPTDELVAYGQELGLPVDPATSRGELLRLIRARKELLLQLDQDALLDIMVWAPRPIRKSASKEHLAREAATIRGTRYEGLSDRGLRAWAMLQGISVDQNDSRELIERRLHKSRGITGRLRQMGRSKAAGVVSWLLHKAENSEEYKFLPEEKEGSTFRRQMEDVGVVAGIAQKLRGAADQYVHEKLDEIERRIDRKLDEIDARLSEWRDREIRSRLQLVKITLATTIVVALISLGYHFLKTKVEGPQSNIPAQSAPPQLPVAAPTKDR